MINSNLSVYLSRSIQIPCTAGEGEDVTTSNSDRYLDISVAYAPDCCETINKEERLSREAADRKWFKAIVDMNPNVDNLSMVIDAAAKALIETVKPVNVAISATLSGPADTSSFCTKTVNYQWDKEKNG